MPAKKQDAQTKVAWIGAAGIVLAALITGIFSVQSQKVNSDAKATAAEAEKLLTSFPANAKSQLTPASSPNLLSDTPPNSLLEVGQTWRQEGSELTLRDFVYTSDGLRLFPHLYFTNQQPLEKTIRYSIGNNFRAWGKNNEWLDIIPSCVVCVSKDEFTEVVVQPLETIYIAPGSDLLISIYPNDPKYDVITLNAFSIGNVTEASWNIQIHENK